MDSSPEEEVSSRNKEERTHTGACVLEKRTVSQPLPFRAIGDEINSVFHLLNSISVLLCYDAFLFSTLSLLEECLSRPEVSSEIH